jgi:hypothetical protein
MSDETAREHPATESVVELISASRGDTLISWSEGLHDGDVIVAAPLDALRRPVSLDVGEHLEVVWRDDDGLHALPVVLSAVESGERSRWRLRSAGVIRRAQRRDAVRAPLSIPVRIGPEPAQVTGSTTDISEGGLRCVLDGGAAASSRTGDVVHVAVLFPDVTLTCLAEVIREHERSDARREFSLRFIGLTEHQEDLIRRRVFARLRDLRHRGLL